MRRRIMAAAAIAVATAAGAIPTKDYQFAAPLPGTTSAKQPNLVSTLVKDQLVPFKLVTDKPGETPTTGNVQVRVSRAADNTLIFSWRVIMDAKPIGEPVTQLYLNNFPTAVYDANWRSDSVGTVAASQIIGAATGPSGWIMVFTFATPLKSGESSHFMFLKTKATTTAPATGRVTSKDYSSPQFATLAPGN